MGVTDWQMKTKDPIAERCLRPESDEGQGVAGRAEGSGMESKGSFSNCTPSSTLSHLSILLFPFPGFPPDDNPLGGPPRPIPFLAHVVRIRFLPYLRLTSHPRR